MFGRIYLFAQDFYGKNLRLFQAWPFREMVIFFKFIRDSRTIKNQRYRKKGMLEKIFVTILETPHLRCNPNAKTEVHTLTAHHHCCMYITAIKSLLKFFDDIAIVAHDDGSLTDNDRTILCEQVKGIRFIEKKSADESMKKQLADFPHSRRFRQRIVNSMELFDNILLSETEKIITMNSDVLFFKEPLELIAWILSDDRAIISVYEEQPTNQTDFLSKHSCGFPPHVTICLTCFYKQIFNLKFVESALAVSCHDWFTGQNMYPLLFWNKINDYAISFFNKDTYQASGTFAGEAVFRHYWTSTGMFTALQIDDSSKVINELVKTKSS
jgi:hypothetical protein